VLCLRTSTLTLATRARYPELNAEPVPPADPLVALLLETAGGLGMLEHYRATHGGAGEA
jgi:hypothetical protein